MVHFFELIIGPVTAVALSLFVNRLFEMRNKKPLLSFSVEKAYDTIPETQGIGTNPSGYQIICRNIGQVPVFIQYLEIIKLFHRNDFLVEVFPNPEVSIKPVMPYTSVIYELNNEELDSIIHFCKNNNIYVLNINAYSVNRKKYKGNIDLWWIKAMGDKSDVIYI
jgi:hypothetical protein